MSTSKFTAIDLFSGCGGLTEGLKQAGAKVIAAIEFEPRAVEVYRANHPEVMIWEQDIRKIDPNIFRKELSLRKGELDVLAGCPPCQGYSTLRTHNGSKVIRDPRKSLLSTFLSFVEVLRPKTVMLENVPGLSKDWRFRKFREDLEGLGYRGEYAILDAADFGVPQRRRRMIYLAAKKSLGRVQLAKPSTTRRSVRDVIGDMKSPGETGDPLHDIRESRSEKVKALIRRIPKDGGSRTDLPDRYQLDCHKRCDGFKDIYGRMAWDDVAPTITGGCHNPSKGRFLHPEEDRAISMREAALLQGFRRNYRFPDVDNKSALAQMIGNALPPPLVCAHGRELATLLEEYRTKTHKRAAKARRRYA